MQKLSWDEIHRVEHYLGVETEALFRYFDGEDNQKAGDLYDEIDRIFDEGVTGDEVARDFFRSTLIDRLASCVREYEHSYHVYIDEFAMETGYKPHYLLFSTQTKPPKGYMEA